MLSKFSFHRLLNCHVGGAKLALALAVLTTGAQAATVEYVQNGGFEETALPAPTDLMYPGQSLNGWTTESFVTASIYAPGTADTIGALTPGDTRRMLWGPGNGADNGLTATSPAGGNFLAIDGDPFFGNGPISQTITGLTPGLEATLTFWWGAAQQYMFGGPTTEQVQVNLGGQTFFTEVLNTPHHGFQPWRQASFTFIPDSTTAVLSFLGIGTPDGGPPQGAPPFVLLDGVSLTQEIPDAPVPEPASLALIGAGLAGLGAFARLRRKSANL